MLTLGINTNLYYAIKVLKLVSFCTRFAVLSAFLSSSVHHAAQ